MVDTLTGSNQALYQYYTEHLNKRRSNDRLQDKLATMQERAVEDDGHKLRFLFDLIGMAIYGLLIMIADSAEARWKKKTLARTLNCKETELAIDANDLSIKKDAAVYLGDDLTYKATVARDWLKNITLIFGDVRLEALDDMVCLGKLESVWGNVYFPQNADLSGLSLKIVAGNLHGEGLTSTRCLEQLEFVGGTIFYQGQQFRTVEEFRESEYKNAVRTN